MPTLVHAPPGSVERMAQCSPAWSTDAFTVIGYEPALRGAGPSTGFGAQALRQRQPAGVGVQEVHALGAQRHRGLDGVQRDGVRSAPHDQHRRSRPRGQLGAHGAPPVGHVVRQAGHGHRVDRLGQRHEHRVGERHPHPVGKRPAPVTSGRADAVHRGRRHLAAAGGDPTQARVAAPARDLERDDHAVARGDTRLPPPPPPPRPRTRARGRTGPGRARPRAPARRRDRTWPPPAGGLSPRAGPPARARPPPATRPSLLRGTGAGAWPAG